jgi:hypothetical protein
MFKMEWVRQVVEIFGGLFPKFDRYLKSANKLGDRDNPRCPIVNIVYSSA